MSAKLVLSTVTAVLLSAAPLMAGGLPRLCLPVNGVSADNAPACAKRLTDAFGDRIERVELQQNDKRWYVLFSFNAGQLDLGKLDAAFKDSPFSIPRDHLRLFGEVVLAVKIDEAATQKLLTDLKAVKYLTVAGSKRDNGVLYVTAVMPYPPYMGRETMEFGKVSFEKETFGGVRSDFAPAATPPATARDLPSYAGLRTVVEKHKGTLKGLRWELLGCHVQGGVVVSDKVEK